MSRVSNIADVNRIRFKGSLYVADPLGYYPEYLVFVINSGIPSGMKVYKDFIINIIGASGNYKLSLFRERIDSNEFFLLKDNYHFQPTNIVKANFYMPLEYDDV